MTRFTSHPYVHAGFAIFHVQYIKKYDFALKTVFESSVVSSEQSTMKAFHLHDENVFSTEEIVIG